ncbi:hypothetical protein BJ912DRAFT_993100 [Pholiota molesta]|nr:hypothetical protein BJ912DRAFT_993100 [Pholiota molesta]
MGPHVSFVSSVFVFAGYVDSMPGRGATVNVIVIWSMWQAELVPLGRHVCQIILAKFVVVLLCVGVGVVAARFGGFGFTMYVSGVYLLTGLVVVG